MYSISVSIPIRIFISVYMLYILKTTCLEKNVNIGIKAHNIQDNPTCRKHMKVLGGSCQTECTELVADDIS